MGYDVHKFEKKRKLILGGVEIPNDVGLLGHSDADVLLHAIADSLLGAAALGDIGVHFPDSSDKYKDIDSMILLKEVANMIKENGYSISNIDSTIVCQTPKLMSYIMKMRENISSCLQIDISRISVKATTTERLGFEGRCEGISAYATSLLDE